MIPRSLVVVLALVPLACGGTTDGSSGGGGTAGATGGTASGATGSTVSTGGVGATGNICDLPVEPGACTSETQLFYFDASLGTCAEFTYSGCGGNANRFATALSCMNQCGGGVPDLCTLPRDSGPCEADVPSYYFDPSTGRCELFSYGGCEGNANRFATETECLATCGDVDQAECPVTTPLGACTTEGMACTYSPYDQCLCIPYDVWQCDPVPACYGTGGASSGGASSFVPPPTGGGGSSSGVPVPGGGGSSDIADPMPATILCNCTAGAWQCQTFF